MAAYEAECKLAGLDIEAVDRICRGLARYGTRARALGLTIFGGSGTGSLRVYDDHYDRPLIVGMIDGGLGSWDGGDGATHTGDDGYEWGE